MEYDFTFVDGTVVSADIDGEPPPVCWLSASQAPPFVACAYLKEGQHYIPFILTDDGFVENTPAFLRKDYDN